MTSILDKLYSIIPRIIKDYCPVSKIFGFAKSQTQVCWVEGDPNIIKNQLLLGIKLIGWTDSRPIYGLYNCRHYRSIWWDSKILIKHHLLTPAYKKRRDSWRKLCIGHMVSLPVNREVADFLAELATWKGPYPPWIDILFGLAFGYGAQATADYISMGNSPYATYRRKFNLNMERPIKSEKPLKWIEHGSVS